MAPQTDRPLSPFLTYRWTLTMAMSLIHRATGIALYGGTLLMAWGLIATASSPAAYACFEAFATSWIGRIVIFGFTWSLMHHALSGLRYLVWDTGHGYAPGPREGMTRGALIGGVLATIAVWAIACYFGAGR